MTLVWIQRSQSAPSQCSIENNCPGKASKQWDVRGNSFGPCNCPCDDGCHLGLREGDLIFVGPSTGHVLLWEVLTRLDMHKTDQACSFETSQCSLEKGSDKDCIT